MLRDRALTYIAEKFPNKSPEEWLMDITFDSSITNELLADVKNL